MLFVLHLQLLFSRILLLKKTTMVLHQRRWYLHWSFKHVICLNHQHELILLAAAFGVLTLKPLLDGIWSVVHWKGAPFITRWVQRIHANRGHFFHQFIIRSSVQKPREIFHVFFCVWLFKLLLLLLLEDI